MLFNDLSDDEFVRIANMHVEALNHALRDIDPEHVRVHICWGNYEGLHVCDIDMDKVFSTLMSTRARYVLFETSNPCHAHEWTVFRDRKAEIPDDKILVPVVNTTTNLSNIRSLWPSDRTLCRDCRGGPCYRRVGLRF